MPEIYFENENTKKRFKVVEFNREAGTVRLKGDNAEFTESYDKERFQRMGYALKQA